MRLCKTQRASAVLLVFIMVFYCGSIEVVGAEETANDLFTIYNEAELDDYNVFQSAYLIAKAALDDAVSDAQQSELYNATIQSATDYLEQAEGEIDAEIDELIQSNQSIKEEIKDNIFDEWDNLLVCDARYKINVSQINDLVEEKNKYVVLGKQDVDYDSIGDIESEVEELSEKYKSASEVAILGDVSNVVYPVNAETWMTSEWGYRLDPISGSSITFHSGIDLHASTGTEVLSLFNGTVYDTGYTATGGNYVKVYHGNGIVSYYCHLSEILCSEGQQVTQYDCIALSGNTGSRTTGPHLHLGIYINNNSVDPAILFSD